MTSIRSFAAGLVCVVLHVSAVAKADVLLTNNRTVFQAQGTIVYDYGFEDVTLNYNGLCYEYAGWTTHGVTYTATTDHYNVEGTSSWLHPISNMLVYDAWSPVTATISPSFNMLGFDLACMNYIGVGPVSIVIDTNVGSYSFPSETVPDANAGQEFFGFTTTSNGEYFKSISLSCPTWGQGPALDNVTLGNGVVPEPGSIALLFAGGLSVLACSWRKRRKLAALTTQSTAEEGPGILSFPSRSFEAKRQAA